jgi:hypothetical protein
MSLLRRTNLYQSLLAGLAIVLTATLSVRAVAVEQARTPILITNIQEPQEMRVAPFPVPLPDNTNNQGGQG